MYYFGGVEVIFLVGYKLFLEELKKLDVSFQNKVIGNIFDKVVLVFDISINYHGNIYIRFYDGKVYYQYCFIFENINIITNYSII